MVPAQEEERAGMVDLERPEVENTLRGRKDREREVRGQ